jgi:hypothetical protein
VLGEEKPLALEWEAWDDYYIDLKKRKPIRYWVVEKFLKTLQDIIYFPYDLYKTIKVYSYNRWIDKTHYLKTGLKPGHYYDLDYRLIHGLFNELVDFVEIELAYNMDWKDKTKYKFENGRCIIAAYDYFKWANNLKAKTKDGKRVLSEQAKSSRKIQKLYEWWTKIRPARVDPCVMSGYNNIVKDSDDIFKISTKYNTKLKTALIKLEKIEKKYDDEDTAMLIELIKIRSHLWT